MVRDDFICALDGVGGWIEILIDSGLMTKELIKHIASNYDSGSFENLHDLLDKSVRMTKAKGSTTCVMAKLEDSCMSTCNLGDSGYLLLRPSSTQTSVVYKSVS